MKDMILNVKNLNVSFETFMGEVQAVRHVNFQLERGKTLAIVGESGCGKTVTAKTLMGLIQSPGKIHPQSEVWYHEKNLLQQSEKEWDAFHGKEFGMIFQDALTALNPIHTIGYQIAEGLMLHGHLTKKEALQRAEELLYKVGITNPQERLKQYPHELSGGMRQRIMIAIALSCNPKLVIADEPTTSLDVTIQAQILELIKKLQKEYGTTVILITHDLGIVAGMADEIVVMYAGEIVEQGPCRDIFYHPQHPYTQNLLKAVPCLNKKKDEKLFVIEGNPPSLLHLEKGCPFYRRCQHCMNICMREAPPTYRIDEKHVSKCWMHHQKVSNKTYEVQEGDAS